MIFKLITFFSLTLFINASAETIVVTATKIAGSSSSIANSVDTLETTSVQQKNVSRASDWLQGREGLNFSSFGSSGQSQALFLRGGGANQSLVLIDGITANDPMNTDGRFDFAEANPWSIHRIEILRGPQSGLYGSQAMAGVVQFFTELPRPNDPEWTIGAGAGSYSSKNYNARWGKNFGTGAAVVSLNHEASAAFSTANRIYGNKEADGTRKTNVSAKLVKDLDEKSDLDLAFHYLDSRFDLDDNGGANGDSATKRGSTKAILSRGQIRRTFLEDKLSTKLGANLTSHKRKYVNPDDFYNSDARKFDWQNDYTFDEQNTLSLLIDNQEDHGTATDILTSKSESVTGFGVQHVFRGKHFFSSLNGRQEWYERFGEQKTFRVAPGISLFDGKSILRSSYGTAFKAPTLYQTYSRYGSLTLRPEQSQGWDIGAEQKIDAMENATTTMKATYFSQRYKNLINYDSTTNKNQNTDAAKIDGWEFALDLASANKWKLTNAGTYLNTKDLGTGQKLTRRPDWTWRNSFGWNTKQSTYLELVHQYVGRRLDVGPNESIKKTMPGYSLFGVNSSTKINKVWSFSARVENLLDREYEEIPGYGTSSRALYAQIQAQF